MIKVNFKSDFDAVMQLKNCEGEDIPWPDCDFEARFYIASKGGEYLASRKGKEYINCFAEENGGMHFVFDNHGLSTGTLRMELHLALPNSIYPDRTQDVYIPESLDINLVPTAGGCTTRMARISVQAPVKVTVQPDFSKLTREQRDALREVMAGDYDMSDDFNNDFSN